MPPAPAPDADIAALYKWSWEQPGQLNPSDYTKDPLAAKLRGGGGVGGGGAGGMLDDDLSWNLRRRGRRRRRRRCTHELGRQRIQRQQAQRQQAVSVSERAEQTKCVPRPIKVALKPAQAIVIGSASTCGWCAVQSIYTRQPGLGKHACTRQKKKTHSRTHPPKKEPEVDKLAKRRRCYKKTACSAFFCFVFFGGAGN